MERSWQWRAYLETADDEAPGAQRSQTAGGAASHNTGGSDCAGQHHVEWNGWKTVELN